MRPVFPFLALVLSLATLGCSATATPPPPQPTAAVPSTTDQTKSSFPVTITDDSGRQIALAQPPQRIVSLSAGNTEILYALGLEKRVAGVDQYSNYPASAKDKPQVGSFTKPDLEKIVALDPDLILGANTHLKTTLPDLDRRGLPVMIVDPNGVKAVLERIRLVGTATGQQREADVLLGGLRARVEAVEARVRDAAPVRVFFELSPSLHSAGPGSYVDDLIRMAGGTNIAANAGKEWPQLNQESVFLADPEVILLADHTAGETPEKVAARPGWSQLSAVKNKLVFVANPDLVNRPGPRVIEGLEWMAAALHPDKRR